MVNTTPTKREPIRLLVFGASLREESINTRLARAAASIITKHGGTVVLANMREFDSPSFDQDVQDKNGCPPGADAMRKRIEASDAFVISAPEYNAAMPGFLKNAIDWVSRYRPQPFNGHHALIMSASPSMVGGNRGLWSLRVPLEHLGARVYPDMFSLAQADKAFGPGDTISDAQLSERFEQTIVSFMDLVEAAKHYPCAKKAWVEFLGERPNPAIDRVEEGAMR
jgi:chromate reductase